MNYLPNTNISCDPRHSNQFLLLAAAHLSANDKHGTFFNVAQQNKLNSNLLIQTIMNANLLRLQSNFANSSIDELEYTENTKNLKGKIKKNLF